MRNHVLPAVWVAISLATFAQAETQNETLAREAFAALDQARSSKNYKPAVEAAHVCIARLTEAADRIEASLLAAGEPVVDPRDIRESEQAQVFARGPLNDIGACLFVKVAAEVGLKDKVAAQKTYAQLCRYPHALVWDTGGWFWSPAEGARGELRILGLNPIACLPQGK